VAQQLLLSESETEIDTSSISSDSEMGSNDTIKQIAALGHEDGQETGSVATDFSFPAPPNDGDNAEPPRSSAQSEPAGPIIQTPKTTERRPPPKRRLYDRFDPRLQTYQLYPDMWQAHMGQAQMWAQPQLYPNLPPMGPRLYYETNASVYGSAQSLVHKPPEFPAITSKPPVFPAITSHPPQTEPGTSTGGRTPFGKAGQKGSDRG
jgi:hypothetical protein